MTEEHENRGRESEQHDIEQIYLEEFFIAAVDVELFDIGLDCLLQRVVQNRLAVVRVGEHEQIGGNGQLGHKEPHLLYMDINQPIINPTATPLQQPKKRFCCGAAKRLKDKCLRFHQNEEMCIEFIKGHQECVAVKRRFENNQIALQQIQ